MRKGLLMCGDHLEPQFGGALFKFLFYRNNFYCLKYFSGLEFFKKHLAGWFVTGSLRPVPFFQNRTM